MANADHVNWLIQGRIAWNGRRNLIEFSPDLSDVDFSDVLGVIMLAMPMIKFFRGYDFSGANLRGSKLIGLDLSNANFNGADLSGANLTGSNLNSAKFNKAKLNNIIAKDASFANAKFNGTVWNGAQLTGAMFSEGFLEEGYLSSIQMQSVVTNLQTEQEMLNMLRWAPPSDPIKMFEPPKKQTYLVTFATNRIPIRCEEELTFGSERDNKLNYGACQVFVPKTHKVGSLGSPFWKRLFKGDDRLKIRHVHELDSVLYWEFVRENFSDLFHGTPPTIAIHGYNVGFEQAVLWAAQIGYDLGLERGISLFSWPSKNSVQCYPADEATVEASKYHLAEYLLDFIHKAGGLKINVLAHSMGCRCLAGALEIIGTRYPEKLSRFKHLIFAAADVDQGVMHNLGTSVVGNSGLTTSYICSKDKAVHLSAVLHQFARVGFLPPVFLMNDVDTVEIEKGDLLGLGHSYISDAKELLMDMHQILSSSKPVEKRFSIRRGAQGHWVLKN